MAVQEEFAARGGAGLAPGRLRGGGRLGRRVVFGLFAALILFGPAPGQLFGQNTPVLRNWVMFSGVGTGILRGEFRLEAGDGQVIAVQTPLEALGLQRYPQVRHYFFPHRVFSPEALAPYAAGLCAEAGPGLTVSFHGVTGTRQGWRDITTADLCAPPATDASAAPAGEAGE